MRKQTKVLILGGLFLFIFVISTIIDKQTDINIPTSVEAVLNNVKVEWGIKRNDNHQQPDLGAKNEQLIAKYNGIAIGDKEKKYVYLTFDAGYEAGYTDKILDALKVNEVKATFFITAHYVNSEPELVKRMIDEGHIIGNHTVNHKSMPSLSDDEFNKEVMDLHQVIFKKFGYEMKYIRPPKGEFSERTLSLSEKLGYTTVMWSFAYVDWDEKKQPAETDSINKIISNLHNGEVMLLHSTSKTNAGIMDEMIKKVKEEGYEFRSLDEFV